MLLTHPLDLPSLTHPLNPPHRCVCAWQDHIFILGSHFAHKKFIFPPPLSNEPDNNHPRDEKSGGHRSSPASIVAHHSQQQPQQQRPQQQRQQQQGINTLRVRNIPHSQPGQTTTPHAHPTVPLSQAFSQAFSQMSQVAPSPPALAASSQSLRFSGAAHNHNNHNHPHPHQRSTTHTQNTQQGSGELLATENEEGVKEEVFSPYRGTTTITVVYNITII